MAEDPEISKRRHEQQQLRKQLHEVFGPFDQFCEYVAGTTSAGSSGIMRHGVVQLPTTPLTPSARSTLPTTSSSASSSTAPQQSTQQLLMSMQNLVTSPIQPLQGLPFSCNRDYLNTAPSSTHSAPDTDNSAKKGKRHRALDSDSEVDRDKRRRRNEEVRTSVAPSTSRSNPQSSNSDSIRTLSPPLSPIKQRPSDKKAERERKEMETKEKRKERDRHSNEKRSKDSERKDRPSERSDKVKTGDGERQKPTENEHKSDEHCMPRASSSQSHEGGEHSQNHRPSSVVGSHPSRNSFECAAPECVPTKPSRPVKPEESDKVNKMLFYLDTSVYFLLSAKHFTSADSPEVRGNRQYSIIRDTNDLLKRVTHAFCQISEGCSPWHMHMLSRIRNLSSRCQACLLYHMYNFRSHNAIKSYGVLVNMETQIQEERHQAQNGASATTSSSPGDNAQQSLRRAETTVEDTSSPDVVPSSLAGCAKRADISSLDMAFISGLEKVCGQLFLDAPLEKMCAYMLTAIAWLRAEYEREKVRAPPPIAKRAG
ncbi:hypothetical protein OSTOST_09281, partial [Ostertagia ostertagi]